MNTSQYPVDTRKQLKHFQRSSGYKLMKKAHCAELEMLETKLRARNETIRRLTKKLVELGVDAVEVDKLAT